MVLFKALPIIGYNQFIKPLYIVDICPTTVLILDAHEPLFSLWDIRSAVVRRIQTTRRRIYIIACMQVKFTIGTMYWITAAVQSRCNHA